MKDKVNQINVIACIHFCIFINEDSLVFKFGFLIIHLCVKQHLNYISLNEHKLIIRRTHKR